MQNDERDEKGLQNVYKKAFTQSMKRTSDGGKLRNGHNHY